jgi:hypothetical protein
MEVPHFEVALVEDLQAPFGRWRRRRRRITPTPTAAGKNQGHQEGNGNMPKVSPVGKERHESPQARNAKNKPKQTKPLPT